MALPSATSFPVAARPEMKPVVGRGGQAGDEAVGEVGADAAEIPKANNRVARRRGFELI